MSSENQLSLFEDSTLNQKEAIPTGAKVPILPGTYQTMMDVGFNAGLPIGGAVTLFVALVLMGTGPLVAFFLGFLAWLGLLGISKTFFSH